MAPLKAGNLWQSQSWWAMAVPGGWRAASPRHTPGHPGHSPAGQSLGRRLFRKGQPTVAAAAFFVAFLAFPLYFLAQCWMDPAQCSLPLLGSAAPSAVKAAPQEPLMDDGPRNYTDPFSRALPEVLVETLKSPWKGKAHTVPVVQFYQRPGALPCNPRHYIARSLKQARQHNSIVYFIGPEECAALANELDIILDPYTEYRDVIEWFRDKIGHPVGYQVRWFVLRAFMERHAFSRIFYMDSDVLLFANMTDMAYRVYKRIPILLSVRWPSLRSLGPSQYATTAVSGHVSMWTYDALCDYLAFFQVFFKEAVLFGEPGNRTLVTLRPYNDMITLGWYTFKICWMRRPEDLHPQCIADVASGVTPERSIRIRGKFAPKYKVDSFAAPRWCEKTEYTNQGWCVFDNNFSVQSPKQFFKFQPHQGMKTPTSIHYTHFEDWSKDQEKQTLPVQFLAVHFQAHKKGYLERGDDPATTWGSNTD